MKQVTKRTKSPSPTKSNPAKTAAASVKTADKSAPAPTWTIRVQGWLASKSLLLAAVAVLIATLRIVATYPVFNHTIDEPAHIACGMEWLSKGTYRLEPQHPPLARVFS